MPRENSTGKAIDTALHELKPLDTLIRMSIRHALQSALAVRASSLSIGKVKMQRLGYVLLGLSIVLAMVSFGVFLLTFSPDRHSLIDRAKDTAQILSPLITLVSVFIALFVAYQTWLLPFRVEVQSRPILWRLAPTTPGFVGFNIAVYSAFSNVGAISGTVSDLLVEIDLPKGKWIMEPQVFLKSAEYYHTFLDSQITRSPGELIEAPFTPIFLPGRTQVSKAVLFGPVLGEADFNLSFIESGEHALRVFARYDLEPRLTRIIDAKLIFQADHLAQWKQGITIGGELRHRDTNIKALPR